MYALRLTNTTGIGFVAFVIAIAVSPIYFQYFYLPEVNKRLAVPDEVMSSPETVTVTIGDGSSIPSKETMCQSRSGACLALTTR